MPGSWVRSCRESAPTSPNVTLALHPRPRFYKWKAKYGGVDVSEARLLKALEEENANPAALDAGMTDAAGRRDARSRQLVA